MTDHIKIEVSRINEMNQNNVDFITQIFMDKKELLVKSELFQRTYTKSWNPTVMETSQMIYLELSKHNKISNDGAIQVLVEFLHDYCLIDKDSDNYGSYILSTDIESKRLRIYRNGLSIERIRNMENRVYSIITHPGKDEFVEVILTGPS